MRGTAQLGVDGKPLPEPRFDLDLFVLADARKNLDALLLSALELSGGEDHDEAVDVIEGREAFWAEIATRGIQLHQALTRLESRIDDLWLEQRAKGAQ